MIRKAAFLLVLVAAGCQSGIGTSADIPAAQARPDIETSIGAGIYAGEVTCRYTSRNSAVGLVEDYDYSFEETFVFDERGIPNAGVLYDPQNDEVELFGAVFDVTNRTYSATATRYSEEAALSGTVEGDRVNGVITWLFTRQGAQAVSYHLQIAWTYRSAGVAWNIDEACEGSLTR